MKKARKEYYLTNLIYAPHRGATKGGTSPRIARHKMKYNRHASPSTALQNERISPDV